METSQIAPEDLFTTYMQLWRTDFALPQGINTFTNFRGFFNQINPNEWTVGMVAERSKNGDTFLNLRPRGWVLVELGEAPPPRVRGKGRKK